MEPRTIVRSPLTRRQTGYDLDLDGFDTDHISMGDTVLYRNPFQGLRLNDEEIAISTFLTAMADLKDASDRRTRNPLHPVQAPWGPAHPSSTTKLANVRTGAPGRCTVSTTRRSVLQRRWSTWQRR